MSDWIASLDRTSAGLVRGTVSNAVAVLQHDPTWGADRLWYDAFLDRVLIAESPAREWSDEHDTALTVYMQEAIGIRTIPEAIVASAVGYVARQRRRHCICDWLDTLTWDDEPRLDTAFVRYWGAEVTPQQPKEYIRAASRNFFLSLVARVRRPGCKADCMPVFEGLTGIGKERALTAIGAPWYMVSQYPVSSIDFFRSLPGKWIVEIGEMDSFSRAEKERIKLAVSTPEDRYRIPNARRAKDVKRQCIFAGTTNRDDWGNDDTGLRRFWPVRCGTIDVDALHRDREQLFAEASARYAEGCPWWEMPLPETRAVQADRQSDDVWTVTVLDWVYGKPDTTVAEVLREALKIRDAEMTRLHQLRIGSILALAGWTKRMKRLSGRFQKTWFPPETD